MVSKHHSRIEALKRKKILKIKGNRHTKIGGGHKEVKVLKITFKKSAQPEPLLPIGVMAKGDIFKSKMQVMQVRRAELFLLQWIIFPHLFSPDTVCLSCLPGVESHGRGNVVECCGISPPISFFSFSDQVPHALCNCNESQI